MTQNEMVLALLRERGEAGLTPLDAERLVGSMRLAARILEIKGGGSYVTRGSMLRPGERIDTDSVTANGKTFARYVLRTGPVPTVPPPAPIARPEPSTGRTEPAGGYFNPAPTEPPPARIRERPMETPYCPVAGCHERLGDLRETVAPGWWNGKCPNSKHKRQTVRWTPST